MRKETIIKFEKEFMAWCKGESILKGAPISMGNRELYWKEVKDFADWKALDTVYVLNDSYSTYRKALAEGKTVQYCLSKNYHPDVWYNLDSRAGFHHSPDEYRIKPEEPQFKVGDWVRNNSSNVTFKYTTGMLKPDPFCCEHWQPQPDDYAWFYDYEKYTPTFGKFIQVENDKYLAEIADGKGSLRLVAFTYCEPFLGTLPTFLKPE